MAEDNINEYIDEDIDEGQQQLYEHFRFEVDPNMNGGCVAMPTEGTESLAELVNQCIAELNDSGKPEEWYSQYEAAAAELGIK